MIFSFRHLPGDEGLEPKYPYNEKSCIDHTLTEFILLHGFVRFDKKDEKKGPEQLRPGPIVRLQW